MTLSETTFRRLVAIVALICALVSLVAGSSFLVLAVVLLAVVLLV